MNGKFFFSELLEENFTLEALKFDGDINFRKLSTNEEKIINKNKY